MSKTIIRVNKKTNYVVISKEPIQDANLSWKAKGLLVYLLSLPDDWQIYIEELSTHSKDGIDSTSTAINELIKNGYVTRERIRDEKGHYKNFVYTVHEIVNDVESVDNSVNENANHEEKYSNLESTTLENGKEKEPIMENATMENSMKKSPVEESPTSGISVQVSGNQVQPNPQTPDWGNRQLLNNNKLSNNKLSNNELNNNRNTKKVVVVISPEGVNVDKEVIELYEQCISKDISTIELKVLEALQTRVGKEVLIKAITIAVMRNNRNLAYIQGVLEKWRAKELITLEEIETYLEEWKMTNRHNERQVKKRIEDSNYRDKESHFNDFEQRGYDYDKLERKLLGWDMDSDNDIY